MTNRKRTLDQLDRREALRWRVTFYCEHLFYGHGTKMAKYLGVSQSTVTRTLNGEYGPGPALLEALAKHPRVNRAFLLDGQGAPFADSEMSPLAPHVKNRLLSAADAAAELLGKIRYREWPTGFRRHFEVTPEEMDEVMRELDLAIAAAKRRPKDTCQKQNG